MVLTKSGCDSYGRDSYSCPCDEIASEPWRECRSATATATATGSMIQSSPYAQLFVVATGSLNDRRLCQQYIIPLSNCSAANAQSTPLNSAFCLLVTQFPQADPSRTEHEHAPEAPGNNQETKKDFRTKRGRWTGSVVSLPTEQTNPS